MTRTAPCSNFGWKSFSAKISQDVEQKLIQFRSFKRKALFWFYFNPFKHKGFVAPLKDSTKGKNAITGSRHSSVDTSGSTILRVWVRCPYTTSMLFQLIFQLWWEKDESKQTEAGIGQKMSAHPLNVRQMNDIPTTWKDKVENGQCCCLVAELSLLTSVVNLTLFFNIRSHWLSFQNWNCSPFPKPNQ